MTSSPTSSFGIQPTAFRGEPIHYLSQASFFEAVEQYLTYAPVQRDVDKKKAQRLQNGTAPGISIFNRTALTP